MPDAEQQSTGWQPIETAPKAPHYGPPHLGVVDGEVRLIRWGKTSHVPLYGWCLADQGAEEFDHYRKDCADAADEIERLCRIPAHYGAPVDDPDAAIQWITGLMDTEARHLREEVKRLRAALLAGREWLEVVSPPSPESASGVRMREFRRLLNEALAHG